MRAHPPRTAVVAPDAPAHAHRTLTLGPIRRVQGTVHLPGSKSLSNRTLLLAAMASGETAIDNLLDSDDTRRMREALAALGVVLRTEATPEGERLHVQGVGGPFVHTGDAPLELYLGNAGTAVRPLTAALCLGSGTFVLRGDARMHERPIGDLTDALLPLGVNIEFLGNPGYLPLRIEGTGLPGGTVRVRGDVSSQFLTALLMSAPLARAPMRIEVDGELVSKPYILITLASLAQFGVQVRHDDALSWFEIEPTALRSPGRARVEGDASSATYFLAAAAIAGGPVRVHGIDRSSVQGDVAFVDVLSAMGAKVSFGDGWVEVERGGSNRLRAVDLDLNHIPDAAMTVVVAALFADGTTRVRNLWNLRVKETDRLSAMTTELRKLGATVEEGRDYLVVTPPARLRSATIDTYDDHRMAMAFSLAALGDVPVTINDPDCVAKTFPDYFERFARICS
jgi:3-phosphoshikimate 1-carboxyvinyltransferase